MEIDAARDVAKGPFSDLMAFFKDLSAIQKSRCEVVKGGREKGGRARK